MKLWRNLLICFGLFGLFWLGLDRYLAHQINARYSYAINDDYGITVRDKGLALQQTSLDNGDIMIFGTSELDSYVEQNPRVFFPTHQQPYNVNIIGRGGVLNLEHSLNISTLDFSRNQKVIYLVSFPWFISSSIDSNTFYANFSKLKYYRYMTDSHVPREDKLYAAAQVAKLTQNNKNRDDLDAWGYSKLCAKFPGAFPVIQAVSSPYLLFAQAATGTKDKMQSLKFLMQQQATPPDEPRNIDWAAEFARAEQQGQEVVHDPQFYFDDKTMAVMADKLKVQKNFLATNPNLITSLEYNDYRLFLKTCQRKGIKPLIIIQPVNGWYFDYTGIDRTKREAVYNKLCVMAEEYGFTAYNPIELEYMPYAFFDMWHFGWKGWLYVDQEITEYFAEDR